MRQILFAHCLMSMCVLAPQGVIWNTTLPVEYPSSATQHVGYDNCDMKSNGELRVIRDYIHAGDVVVDVGAHTGEGLGHVMAQHDRVTIHACEPCASVYEQLAKVKKVGSNTLFCYNIGLSNFQGVASLHHFGRGPSELSSLYDREILHRMMPGLNYEQVTVATLDDFCLAHAISRIDFLKIDTEGAEWPILQGASKLLLANHIRAIQFEYGGCYKDAGTTLHDVWHLLTRHGYAVYRILSDRLICIDTWQISLENYRYSNFLALAPNRS